LRKIEARKVEVSLLVIAKSKEELMVLQSQLNDCFPATTQ
jgi:hypothetical protein